MKTKHNINLTLFRQLTLVSALFVISSAQKIVAQIPQNIQVTDEAEQTDLWTSPYGMAALAILFFVMVGIYFTIRRRRQNKD